MTSDNAAKPKPRSFKDLTIWQKGMTLAKVIYSITATFPSEEKFGLMAQMRRAAVSIPSNVAEGQARHTRKEFVQFISHAEGSVAEHWLSSQACAKPASTPALELLDELRRMLNSLRRKLTAGAP